MGFFSKLKQDLSHGGIKLNVQAPATVQEQDASFNAEITIAGSGEAAQTINHIKVSLKEDHTEHNNFQTGQQNNTMPNGPVLKELSSAIYSESFAINPGETKTITVAVPLNVGKLASQALPQNGALAAAAGVLGKLETVADAMNNTHYRHYVEAVAEVAGIRMSPSARADIQLLKPGQFGTGLNVRL
jgi:hypothetical protein